MPKPTANRFVEMETFDAVVGAGSLSAAARRLQLTPSAVSKLLSRLEERIGARLLLRTTHSVRLTAEGEAFAAASRKILAALSEAEGAAGDAERPEGHIVLSTSPSYAAHVLDPIVGEFLAAYPQITLELQLTDRVADLVGERIDVAVRAGPLKSSGLVARRLGSTAFCVVAARSYLDGAGTPRKPADLAKHRLLGLSYGKPMESWPFVAAGRRTLFRSTAALRASDGEGLRRLAVGGAGIARMARFTIARDVAEGRLKPLLETCNPGDRQDFHAVYVGRASGLPTRVRVLLDFLAARGQVDDTLRR